MVSIRNLLAFIRKLSKQEQAEREQAEREQAEREQAEREPFTHRTLPEYHIRLVHIVPSQVHHAPIACRISVHHERQCPEYQALSYTWGDPEEGTQTIRIDGRPFTVRSNLWLFLNQLRHESSTRAVWADALCIDQENIEERNHQVGLMDRIYRGAERTLIWLGPADQHSDILFEIMSKISKMILLRQKLFENNTQTISKVHGWYEARDDAMRDLYPSLMYWIKGNSPKPILRFGKDFPTFLENIDWILRAVLHDRNDLADALSSLVKRPYWSRVWIIQEIVLSSHIELFCGSKTALWEGLRCLLRSCDARATHANALPVAASMATTLCREWERRHETPVSSIMEVPRGSKGLEYVLDRFEASICTDVRDKIYGLLSLIETSLEADYHKTPIQLFLHLMASFNSDLSQESAYAQEYRISDLLHFGKLLLRTLKLDVYSPKGSVSTNEYGSILQISSTLSGTVVLSGLDIQNSEESETNFLNDLMARISAEECEIRQKYFRTSIIKCIQRLKSGLSIRSAESTCSIDYTQFRSNIRDPEAAITLVSLSYSPADYPENSAWSQPSSRKISELCWFVSARGCVGVSDVDVREGDLICNCGSIGPTQALVMRESQSGIQIIGRAMLSSVAYMNGERQFGRSEIKSQRLDISFDAISLLAFVLLPFP